jgi:uncharacterized sodium:solute symporter family permease YidK
MNLRLAVSQTARAFQDNPGLIALTVCGVVAVLFISLMFLPRWFRRRLRRRRGKKRSAQI